jgi:hypothetical protein
VKLAGIGFPLSSVKVHNADGAGTYVAQPLRAIRIPRLITVDRRLKTMDDLFITGIPYLTFVRLLGENIWWSRRVLGLQILEVLRVIGPFLGGHPFQQRPLVCRLLLQKAGL